MLRSNAFSRGSMLLLLPLGLAIGCTRVASQEATAAREIERALERLRADSSASLAGAVVSRTDVLLTLYERRGFRPLWSEERAAQLLAAVRSSRLDGLDPEDYHLSALASSHTPAEAVQAAALDVVRTDALIRVAHDLRFGKLEPSGPGSGLDLSRPLRTEDAVADLEAMVSSNRGIGEELGGLRSDHFVYRGLVRALADLRRIEEQGGWARIPDGPVLRLDSLDVRVPLLRSRLALEGDLLDASDPSLRFDAALEAAVRSFQHRHGLNEDGVVGRSTLDAFNVPIGARIDQIRVNLERARWVTLGLPDTVVVVNIAGAKVYLVQAGAVALETRAVVGTTYTRTPVFRATMTHVELNPTWTVPTSIVDEVLAEASRDPGYMTKQGMRMLDAKGDSVPSRGIDFARFKPTDFPWTLRQDPGPLNPLGRIKLVFPNAHNVYLHDTPSRQLFEREQRLFSHGCIRVQDPLALAELLLGDPVQWSRAGLEAAIARGETLSVPLTRPVEVLIQYWTASVDEKGVLHFYRDVYGRDAAVLAALGPG